MYLKNIDSAIVIEKVNVIDYDNQLFVRTISSDGITGYVKANARLKHGLSMLKDLIIPHFIGQDVRNLEELIKKIYFVDRNYKYAGLPFWNGVGHLEVSIFDLIGKTLGKPAGELLGEVRRKEIPVYWSRFNRTTDPDEEVDKLIEGINQYKFNAIKLKIGGRMSENADVYPGYTEELITKARNRLPEDLNIFVDANGSYRPGKAIEVGKMLEDYNIDFFEEPCPWQDFDGTRKVNQNLKIPVAGGEQDSSLYKFKWMIEKRAVDIIQPDIFYNGGLIRTLKVARMAKEAGIKVAPHSPKTGIQAAPMLHFVSVIKNAAPFHEYKIAGEVENGKVKVPVSPGLGFDSQEEKIAKGKVIVL